MWRGISFILSRDSRRERERVYAEMFGFPPMISESVDGLLLMLVLLYVLNKLLASNPRVRQDTKPYGQFDANGILWDSASVGRFVTTPKPGITTVYELIANATKTYADKPALGKRPLLVRHYEAGPGGKQVEKLELGPSYEWMSYAEYGTTINDLGSFFVGVVGMKAKEKITIYAETQREWSTQLAACDRSGTRRCDLVSVRNARTLARAKATRRGIHDAAALPPRPPLCSPHLTPCAALPRSSCGHQCLRARQRSRSRSRSSRCTRRWARRA